MNQIILIFAIMWIFTGNVEAQLQSDISDNVWSIVMPLASSQDIDMGKVLVNSMKDSVVYVFISNIGSWKFRVDSIYFRGADAPAFSMLAGFPKFELEAGKSSFAEFRFVPTAARNYQAEIVIITQADTLIQNIIGEGVQPRVDVLNKIIDFRQVDVGNYKDSLQALTIQNTGSAPISISNVNQEGPDKTSFVINSGGNPFTLQPGEIHKMDIRFKPGSQGRTSGSLMFNYNEVGSPAMVQLFGEGLEPELLILKDTIDFGVVQIGNYKDTLHVTTIKNVGNTPLNITSTNHAGNNSIDFSTISGYGPFSLSPGEEATMDLQFKPSSAGKTDGTIEFHYDSPQSPALVYLLAEGWSDGTSTMTIESQSVEAYPGDIVEINIILKDHEYLEFTKATGINIDLFFNPTLLWPLEETFEYIDDTTAKLYLEDLPIIKNEEEDFIRIKCKVGLGNKEECVLLLSNAESMGEEIQINLISGNFKLLGICREGGTRLVNPNAQAGMMTIAPNPAENKLEISLSLTEKGQTEICIYNVLGEVVQTIFSEDVVQCNTREISTDLSGLSTGQYLIILKTPTYVESSRLMIIK